MGHGLRIPTDIDRWHAWQRRQSPVRQLTARMRDRAREVEHALTVVRSNPDADICVVVDATHASVAGAILSPLQRLPPERVVLVLDGGVELDVEGPRVQSDVASLGRHLRGVRAVLSGGHYTTAGAATLRATPGASHFVAQHGALTPFAPPLPADSTVLAWSHVDGAFWQSGRTDVDIAVIGSQLLWRAAGEEAPPPAERDGVTRLTFLGQGHAAEVPRARMLEASLRFCRSHDAVYRPHPSERDRLSRLALRAYELAGIDVRTGPSLADLQSPVVSVFSTGILEAAARGRDSWAHFPRPPVWLGEFWERYGMQRYGTSPTPAPPRAEVEPASSAATLLLSAAG